MPLKCFLWLAPVLVFGFNCYTITCDYSHMQPLLVFLTHHTFDIITPLSKLCPIYWNSLLYLINKINLQLETLNYFLILNFWNTIKAHNIFPFLNFTWETGCEINVVSISLNKTTTKNFHFTDSGQGPKT